MRGLYRGVAGFILVMVFSFTFVNAELIVNGPNQAKVNVGDDISLSGYVLRGDDVLGLLKFELKCTAYSSILSTKTISLKAGIKKDFLEMFAVTTPNEETCSVKVLLESDGNVLESKTSSLFEVTKVLVGSFSLNEDTVRAGEKVNVAGTVFKQNGGTLEGFAIIDLKKDGESYFTNNVGIKNGVLDYDIVTNDLPGGEYSVNVNVMDNFGNNLIVTAGKFLLVNKIEVNAHSSKVHYFPKEKIKVTGTSSTFDGKLKKGMAYLTFDDQKYETDVRGGDFDFSFYLLNTITSGKHNINIRVEDESGNYGTYGFSIIVDAIPSKITVVMDAESINPGGKILVKAFLNDQAGDIIEEDLVVKVINDKGDVFYNNVKKSGEQFEVNIAEDVVPGNYFMTARYDTIDGEKIFSVGKVVKLDYKMDGQVLVVTNVGNVPYEGSLQVDADGIESDFSISKKINLGIGQETRIDIGKEVVTGSYMVTVNDNVFEDVPVIGDANIGYKWLIYILIALIIILLGYIYAKNRKKFKINRTIKHNRVVHPNRKHGEYGGASINRVKDDKDHVRKYNDYMTRVASFGERKKADRNDGTFFSFVNKGERKNLEHINEDLDISNVYSGVKAEWVREDSKDEVRGEKKDDKKKKDDGGNTGNMFGFFDI
ncbi:MAG: hypothetical protein Q8Q42_01260 [Nanoarchaeota archaeon]|nr:hypothetical protein [Nanoarchaeota archaeon]